jgi:hypothetical protein
MLSNGTTDFKSRCSPRTTEFFGCLFSFDFRKGNIWPVRSGCVVLDQPQHCQFQGPVTLAMRGGWSSTQPR